MLAAPTAVAQRRRHILWVSSLRQSLPERPCDVLPCLLYILSRSSARLHCCASVSTLSTCPELPTFLLATAPHKRPRFPAARHSQPVTCGGRPATLQALWRCALHQVPFITRSCHFATILCFTPSVRARRAGFPEHLRALQPPPDRLKQKRVHAVCLREVLSGTQFELEKASRKRSYYTCHDLRRHRGTSPRTLYIPCLTTEDDYQSLSTWWRQKRKKLPRPFPTATEGVDRCLHTNSLDTAIKNMYYLHGVRGWCETTDAKSSEPRPSRGAESPDGP